ncbi:hypothetical protein P153DRAFT_395796 [Dothidotthia symphoricarpi CBS 119687]|uniref:Uncharacterized protein n=1 Tax=Dothidotthia symphoricarpi CBS 119687 TaxID=1392245 RepID=A0A6A6AHM6_9PLEO|nr:uncharacterized protein P153DRAFT_395796 [Dothidotthia symphoricarpi CBS 119687]KAF2130374.1 hypothetical protein P153DRAFT_395796 [Dothidotthia symphoricarpi CBS 119687]
MEKPTKDLTKSLAVAHDTIDTVQADTSASDDIMRFEDLWHTTVCILEGTLQSGDLDDHLKFGCGEFGLSTGHVFSSEKKTWLSVKKSGYVHDGANLLLQQF